jgi:hypothetical protein
MLSMPWGRNVLALKKPTAQERCRGYSLAPEFKPLIEDAGEVGRMLAGLRRSLQLQMKVPFLAP